MEHSTLLHTTYEVSYCISFIRLHCPDYTVHWSLLVYVTTIVCSNVPTYCPDYTVHGWPNSAACKYDSRAGPVPPLPPACQQGGERWCNIFVAFVWLFSTVLCCILVLDPPHPSACQRGERNNSSGLWILPRPLYSPLFPFRPVLAVCWGRVSWNNGMEAVDPVLKKKRLKKCCT